jgi:hypothetical protein
VIVKEKHPGIFAQWSGTDELPMSVAMQMSDDELAAHGLYRPVDEDTLPPTPWHELGPVRTIRDADGVVRRVVDWVPLLDLETARELVAYQISSEAANRPDLRNYATTVVPLINAAQTLEELADISLPPAPETAHRLHPNPTKVETL